MIEVPILPKVGDFKAIGKVIVDKSKLPDTPDFCMAIGFHRTKDGFDYIPKCFVVINDLDYVRAMVSLATPVSDYLDDVRLNSKK